MESLFESPKIKYLGIILDSRLTWKYHINELCKKLGRSLGMLYKTRKFCNENILRSLYFSLFNSHASYGLAVWGQCSSDLYVKIERLQKRIIRVIKFADFNAPSKPLMKELQILSIKDLYLTKIASLMWDYDHGLLPHTLCSLFSRRSSVHNANLRNVSEGRLYTATRYNTNYGLKNLSFSLIGSKLLNDIKDSGLYNYTDSKPVFMKLYKKSLFDLY